MVSFYLNNLDRKYWPRVITSKAGQQLQNNFNQGLKIGAWFTSFGQNSSNHVLLVFFTTWKKFGEKKTQLSLSSDLAIKPQSLFLRLPNSLFSFVLWSCLSSLVVLWHGPVCASYICIFHLKYIEDGVSDRNPPLALFNNSTYSDKASQSIVKYLSIWVD